MCGTWLIRANYEGDAEVNCKNSRCGATLVVKVESGNTTVTVIPKVTATEKRT